VLQLIQFLRCLEFSIVQCVHVSITTSERATTTAASTIINIKTERLRQLAEKKLCVCLSISFLLLYRFGIKINFSLINYSVLRDD